MSEPHDERAPNDSAGHQPAQVEPSTQFSLWSVLVVITVLSVLMAAGAAWGPIGLILAVLCALIYVAAKYSVGPKRILSFVALGGISVTCLCGLLLPGVRRAPEAARRAYCSNNLKQIGIALHSYHDAFGSFPPAYIADQNGKPMHSWRVLIMPFAEKNTIYKQYDFSEPWDGPHNRLLASQMPPYFACPPRYGNQGTTTSYVAITGPGTAWPGTTCTTRDKITDGTANTLMVVEVENSGINWMEPKDFNAGHVSRGINPKAGQGISSMHPGGVNILFADGSVDFVPDSFPAKVLQAMLTIAGGEKITEP